LVGEFEKNKLETVRVYRKMFKGIEYIDIRIWTLTKNGDIIPTPKGITIPMDNRETLVKLLTLET